MGALAEVFILFLAAQVGYSIAWVVFDHKMRQAARRLLEEDRLARLKEFE